MQALIPAAGRGTRLGSRTDGRPKPLVEVAGESLIGHILSGIRRIGLDEAIVVVGYRREQLIETLGSSYAGVSLTYAVQEEQLGLAHAHLCAADAIEGPVLSINGDNLLPDRALRRMLELREATGVDITTLTERIARDEARRTAVFELDADGEPTGLVEKPEEPPSTLVPLGAWTLPPEIVEACRAIDPSDRGEYELPDAISHLRARGVEWAVAPFEGTRFNINTPDDLKAAESWLDRRDVSTCDD
jgi:glucose-1-phosphate thymidylyltransferase